MVNKLLVSHSLPASMALWRPMSISFRGKTLWPTLYVVTLSRLTTNHVFFTGAFTAKRSRRAFNTSNGSFFCPKFLPLKKNRLENLWNLNADEANPSVHGTRWATITLALETSKNIKIWIDLEMWRPYGPYDTSKRLVTCKIQLKQGPSEDGRSKE